MPAFNPAKPADHSPGVAQEMRDQFNSLKALIDQMQAMKVVTDHYTMLAGDHTVICNASHNINVTLMMAGLDGVNREVVIKNISTFQVLVRGNIVAADSIDGNPSFTNTTQFQADVLQAKGDGNDWYRVAQFKP